MPGLLSAVGMNDMKNIKTKIGYIDRLRLVMTVLVICHHAAITYGAPGGWYMSDAVSGSTGRILLTWFVAVNQSFFMGFFFFLSALFTPGAYDKKGPGKFLTYRLKRLGIPLLFYSFIVSPLTIWLVLKYQGRVRYGFVDFLKGFDGWINFGVLWFVAALLLFTFVYSGLRFLSSTSQRPFSFPGRRGILLFAATIGFLTFLVRIYFPVGWVLKPLGFQPAHFLQYVALYIIGLIAARNNWIETFPVTNNRFWILAASVLVLLCFPALYIFKLVTGVELSAFRGGTGWPSLMTAIWEQLTGFSMIMALAGSFKKHDKPIGRATGKLVRASFAVYIIHPLVLVLMSLCALFWPVATEIKLFVVAPVAVGLSYLCGMFLVKIPGFGRVL